MLNNIRVFVDIDAKCDLTC